VEFCCIAQILGTAGAFLIAEQRLAADELGRNPPPRLARELADLFPGSTHVASVQLGSTPDAAIWEYTKAQGFTFLTKGKELISLAGLPASGRKWELRRSADRDAREPPRAALQ